jgi:hypothetical protein
MRDGSRSTRKMATVCESLDHLDVVQSVNGWLVAPEKNRQNQNMSVHKSAVTPHKPNFLLAISPSKFAELGGGPKPGGSCQ